MNLNKTTAIVLAAGQGRRMKSDIPKQYLLLNDKPILYYTLSAFEKSVLIDDIILVVGESEVEYCKENIVELYHFKKISKIVHGGEERHQSVYNALNAIEQANYVLIHDGARPFVNETMINNIVNRVKELKACIFGVPVKDTIKIANDRRIVQSTPERKKLWAIQTPQAFEFELVKGAYDELMLRNISNITDDSMVIEQMMDFEVKILEGDYKNIKITTPEDLIFAKEFMNHMIL